MDSPDVEIHLVAWSISVADPKRSIRFYEALGFRYCGGADRVDEADSEMAKLTGMKNVKSRVDYLARPDGRLELMSFKDPRIFSESGLKPANRTGPNAMHFACSDANTLAARLVDLGGSIIAGSDVRYAMADPDGVRIHFATAPIEVAKTLFGE